MTGSEVGKLITDACDATRDYSHIRTDGNLGMAMIAAAISEHAGAIRELAHELKEMNEQIDINTSMRKREMIQNGNQN